MYCLLAGVSMMWALIGWQSFLVYAQIMGCYLMMKVMPATRQQLPVFFFALGYMLALYVYRLTLPFGDLCYDATYPLMITTQKLTTLAFSISDWRLIQKKGDRMDSERLKWAVREVPSLLEFLSFTLSYQGVLAGPFCHLRMYKAFIEGTHRDHSKEDNKIAVDFLDDTGSCVATVIKKVLAVFFWMAVSMLAKPYFPDEKNVDPEFMANNTMLTRVGYLYVSLFLHRAKYYVTWGLAEIVYNASGMGYNGRDKDGRHDWTGMCNVHVWRIESATSLKVYLDNWNIMTTHWLRHVCYTRVPFQRTMLTFVLSALWHGLFVGYYLTFVSASIFVEAGRKIRSSVRPKFQTSSLLRSVYEVITFVGTQLSLAFLVLSFVILHWEPCIKFHSSFYWFFHIACVVILLVLPARKSSRLQQQQQQQQQQNNNMQQAVNNHQDLKEGEEISPDGESRPRKREVMHVQKS
ncbi:lysophospholipid acyltransferase 1 [Aplysia californica]|uniref:Lysophospholipid acyltransferase 1 n=1 Tax=Aplysia californica TaxID=6500 RepID=A0ABM1W3S9_APLCA|nr:lysophospholipid acyltransferase 1 [Aplysia californica]